MVIAELAKLAFANMVDHIGSGMTATHTSTCLP